MTPDIEAKATPEIAAWMAKLSPDRQVDALVAFVEEHGATEFAALVADQLCVGADRV